MATTLVHTCYRVGDIDASLRFYALLGFEERGRLNFETAYNVYLGLPGGGDVLELTVNDGETSYDLGTGYNHIALTVDSLEETLATLRAQGGVEPEKPPFHPGGREDVGPIAFVADPDGYRIELIDGGAFPTPQDPAR